jgi:hypothetical protein
MISRVDCKGFEPAKASCLKNPRKGESIEVMSKLRIEVAEWESVCIAHEITKVAFNVVSVQV